MKTKYLSLPLAVTLLTSCGWKSSSKEENAAVNTSALYAPPVVTMIKGESYTFKEGIYTPNQDQKFHSHYRYLRAITTGK